MYYQAPDGGRGPFNASPRIAPTQRRTGKILPCTLRMSSKYTNNSGQYRNTRESLANPDLSHGCGTNSECNSCIEASFESPVLIKGMRLAPLDGYASELSGCDIEIFDATGNRSRWMTIKRQL